MQLRVSLILFTLAIYALVLLVSYCSIMQFKKKKPPKRFAMVRHNQITRHAPFRSFSEIRTAFPTSVFSAIMAGEKYVVFLIKGT